ncbi:hypothetical protein GCM10008171_07780 [Methylopila jiangsuensis]|uniref:Uncharacterized protein n=1 Tax=Methylopila jiangsuensis TaxID=586230 RepID=A0A9W6JGC4_9HYPH|nr:hypothetical protein [Methylopila jiangsuensis]MDR6285767.1 hypothetical protein [Methylopila jiangsuensis]GLK75524.1 hypothetical protein GCM10008171_07780 [Methylopila jiangsuensis]
MTSLDAPAFSRTPSCTGAFGVRAAPALIWLACLVWWTWGSYAAGPDLMSTDDAMRLTEVRDLLAGQGWFDLVQRRLDPSSGGVLMHWSRLIDLPIAALLAGLGALFPAETALRLTLTLWPALLFLPALFAAAAIGRALAGPAAGVLSALMLALSPGVAGRFSPGMIDHHGAQAALTLVMLACALNAGRSMRAAIGAGFAGAAMLAIGMETLPMAAAIAGAAALRWAARGDDEAAGAAAFGLSFAGGVAGVALLAAPPAQWTAPVCDALGRGHLAAALAGGLGLALAVRLTRGQGALARLVALGAVGAAALGSVLAASPACLGDPYAALPPRLVTEWLSQIAEARSLPALWGDDRGAAIVLLASVAAGALAGLWLLLTAPAGRRAAAVTTFAVFVVAAALAAWQMRGTLFALALSAPFLAAAVAAAWGQGARPWRGGLALTAFNPAAAALAGLLAAEALGAPVTPLTPTDCPRGDFEALARLPHGLILTPPDAGPFVLAFSPHATVAGPYHRGVSGLMAQLEAFTGTPDQARAILRTKRVDYVALCPEAGDVKQHAAASSAGFAARLLDGPAPDWATPVDLGPGVTLKLWRVAR